MISAGIDNSLNKIQKYVECPVDNKCKEVRMKHDEPCGGNGGENDHTSGLCHSSMHCIQGYCKAPMEKGEYCPTGTNPNCKGKLQMVDGICKEMVGKDAECAGESNQYCAGGLACMGGRCKVSFEGGNQCKTKGDCNKEQECVGPRGGLTCEVCGKSPVGKHNAYAVMSGCDQKFGPSYAWGTECWCKKNYCPQEMAGKMKCVPVVMKGYSCGAALKSARCNGELQCIDKVCKELVGQDERCGDDSYQYCKNGLQCIDGFCKVSSCKTSNDCKNKAQCVDGFCEDCARPVGILDKKGEYKCEKKFGVHTTWKKTTGLWTCWCKPNYCPVNTECHPVVKEADAAVDGDKANKEDTQPAAQLLSTEVEEAGAATAGGGESTQVEEAAPVAPAEEADTEVKAAAAVAATGGAKKEVKAAAAVAATGGAKKEEQTDQQGTPPTQEDAAEKLADQQTTPTQEDAAEKLADQQTTPTKQDAAEKLADQQTTPTKQEAGKGDVINDGQKPEASNDTPEVPWHARWQFWACLVAFLAVVLLCIGFAYRMNSGSKEEKEEKDEKTSAAPARPKAA